MAEITESRAEIRNKKKKTLLFQNMVFATLVKNKMKESHIVLSEAQVKDKSRRKFENAGQFDKIGLQTDIRRKKGRLKATSDREVLIEKITNHSATNP